MQIYIYILLAVFLRVNTSNTSTSITPIAKSRSSILPVKEGYSAGGFWKTKTEWRAYWVKDWAVKKVYVPFWKKVWGPAQVKEWVPTGVAKPHPGWKQHATIH